MTKVCSKCGLEKDATQFCKNKKSKDGLSPICKQCKAEYDRDYRQHPVAKKKIKADKLVWQASSKCKEYHHRYYVRTKADGSIDWNAWAKQHPEEMRAYRKVWADKDKLENPDRINLYAAGRRKTDPQLRLKDSLRARLRAALQKDFKSGSAVRDLGCSIADFKKYLESKFYPGMTWDNYGKGPGCWNIDHIMPMAAFDLTDRQHHLLACYYLNLQPLWFEDNMRKGDKIGFEFGQV
jgi:hypothetical protein